MRPKARTTSLLGTTALILFFATITTRDAAELAFLTAYLFLFVVTIVIAEIWSKNNPGQRHLLNIEDFSVQRGLRTLGTGIGATLGLFALLFLLVPPRWTAEDPWTVARVLRDQVLIVAIVEEFAFRWVFPRWFDLTGTRRSVIAAGVVSQLAFAASHPVVWVAWSAGQFTPASVGFFAWAFGFGLAMWYLLRLRATGRIPDAWRPYVGFGTLVGIHGTVNALNVLWHLEVAGVSLGPLAMGAWWILLASCCSRSSGYSSWRSSSASSGSSSRTAASSRTRSAARGAAERRGTSAPRIRPRDPGGRGTSWIAASTSRPGPRISSGSGSRSRAA